MSGTRDCVRMGQEIDRPDVTHQYRTSASDRPTNRVGCPVDAVLTEERGLFDGDGVFCWTLWSGHEGGLCEGNGNCSPELEPSEFLPNDGQSTSAVRAARCRTEGVRRCSALEESTSAWRVRCVNRRCSVGAATLASNITTQGTEQSKKYILSRITFRC